MNSLDVILATALNVTGEDRVKMINSVSYDIINRVVDLSDTAAGGVALYCTFLLAALGADGKLADQEFAAVEPLFDVLFGEQFDYKDCLEMMRDYDDEQSRATAAEIVKNMPAEIADDMFLVAALLSAADGEVSEEEKAFLRSLL